MVNTKNIEQSSLLIQLRNFGIGPLVGMGISMLTVPITTRLVSPEEFGKSSLFTLVQSIFSVITLFGLDQAFVRFYNDKTIDAKKLLSHCLILPFGLCVIFILGIILFGRELSFYLFGQNETLIMGLLCFNLPALVVVQFSMLIIRMEMRGRTYSALNVTTQIINFSVLLLFLNFYEKTFRSIVFATVASSLCSMCLSIFFTRDSWKLKNNKVDGNLIKQLLLFGMPLIPATMLSWVLNSFDKLALRTWSSFEELGLYAAAFKIVGLLSIIQGIFTTAWVPVAYKWHEEKVDSKKFEQVSTSILAVMSIIFSLIVIFRDVIMLFLGSEYRNTTTIFILLLFVPLLFTVSETTSLGIAFAKKTIYNVYVSLLAVIVNVIGNYLLIPTYGAIGAAFSTCISYMIYFYVRTFFSRKLWYKFKMMKYIINFGLLFIVSFLLCQLGFSSWGRLIIVVISLLIIVYNLFLIFKIKTNWSIKIW